MFLFSHLGYLVQLLYLGKLSGPRYQQKLNKIMNISQKDVILIKNLYLSKQCGARTALSELPDKGWKLGSMTVCWRDAKRWVKSCNHAAVDRICRIAVEDLVLRQEDKPKRHRSAREISYETAILCTKCAQDNPPQSPAQMLQTTPCSAVVWSQSYLPFHSMINNLTVCNKFCYCSIINRKLNNK